MNYFQSTCQGEEHRIKVIQGSSVQQKVPEWFKDRASKLFFKKFLASNENGRCLVKDSSTVFLLFWYPWHFVGIYKLFMAKKYGEILSKCWSKKIYIVIQKIFPPIVSTNARLESNTLQRMTKSNSKQKDRI